MANRLLSISAVVIATAAALAPARAQTPAAPAAATATKNDYADAKNWLCRPGRQDACAVDLAATSVAASGALTREAWTANRNAPIDCFYIYPTVSTDTGVNSDMTADPAELGVVRNQFARFGSQCRLYAPIYRQVTLAGLRRALGPGGDVAGMLSAGLGYDDVRDAWNYYLQHDNQGRGVVLIGHSQGSFILVSLIKNEIDGKPVQSKLVSAILGGTTVAVPAGKDVGGDFPTIPLCKSATQTGCAMVFASFRSTVPAPANTLFGKVTAPGMTAACSNPAALGGGSGNLRAYLAADGNLIVGNTPPPAWSSTAKVDTPFVTLPGMLTAECVTNENATFLAITVKGDPSDPRIDDITGDLLAVGRPQANWGLHLIDLNVTMGNLLDVVAQQAKAYGAKKK